MCCAVRYRTLFFEVERRRKIPWQISEKQRTSAQKYERHIFILKKKKKRGLTCGSYRKDAGEIKLEQAMYLFHNVCGIKKE